MSKITRLLDHGSLSFDHGDETGQGDSRESARGGEGRKLAISSIHFHDRARNIASN